MPKTAIQKQFTHFLAGCRRRKPCTLCNNADAVIDHRGKWATVSKQKRFWCQNCAYEIQEAQELPGAVIDDYDWELIGYEDFIASIIDPFEDDWGDDWEDD